jgi:3-methyladenine DNA glycosylase AlkD
MSTRLNDKLTEIRAFCQKHADPALARKYSRFFTEGYDAYGLDRELIEKQRSRWLEEWSDELGLQGFLELGDLLVQNGKYEEASCAICFVREFTKEFTPETLQRFGAWLDGGFRNWAHTDILSGEVLSHFLNEKIVPLKAFSEWRSAESKWKRRAVPVTLIKVLGPGIPLSRLIDFVSPMMEDSEKVVQQGLGWFLRESWKVDSTLTEKFLMEWKDRCGRIIIRYATEKMPSSKRAKFRKGKR